MMENEVIDMIKESIVGTHIFENFEEFESGMKGLTNFLSRKTQIEFDWRDSKKEIQIEGYNFSRTFDNLKDLKSILNYVFNNFIVFDLNMDIILYWNHQNKEYKGKTSFYLNRNEENNWKIF